MTDFFPMLMNSRGLLIRSDGSHQLVCVPSSLHGCKILIGTLCGTTPEIQDVNVVEIQEGVLEYTTVIYDLQLNTAAQLNELNTTPVSHLGPYVIAGDMLVLKTAVAAESYDDLTDSVYKSDLVYDEVLSTIMQFRSELDEKVPLNARRFLFPSLGASVSFGEGSKMFRDFLGDVDENGFPPGRTQPMPMDLLTRRAKYRTFVYDVSFGSDVQSLEQVLKKRPLFLRRNNMPICAACKRITRLYCSRCKSFYSCGREACHKAAWRVHKSNCK